MASASNFSSVDEKLTESNYELWKIQMKSVLVCNDLWQYVDGTELKPLENAQDWIKKDSKALALINLNISYGQLHHVKKAETSKSAWDTLKGVFESKGLVRKATLYEELLRMKKNSDMTITQHVNEFSSKAGQLKEAGIEIPEELLSIMLLNSLSTEYENFVAAIKSRDDIPTLEALKTKLKEEEARQNDRDAKAITDSVTDSDKAENGKTPKLGTEACKLPQVLVENVEVGKTHSATARRRLLADPYDKAGFSRAITLSPELAAVVGAEQMARHEVVKKVWSIIKERNLYDRRNKQFAICDEELIKVIGVPRFKTFGMMKYLKNHFVD